MIIRAISCLFVLLLCFIGNCCFSQICDTIDIAHMKPVNVSSHVTWHTGADAVDWNSNTSWQSGVNAGDIAYLYIDLGDAVVSAPYKLDGFPKID